MTPVHRMDAGTMPRAQIGKEDPMYRSRWTVLALLLCVSLVVVACATPQTAIPTSEAPPSSEETAVAEPAVEEPTTAPVEEPTAA